MKFVSLVEIGRQRRLAMSVDFRRQIAHAADDPLSRGDASLVDAVRKIGNGRGIA
jgi:hypothetical protein